MRIWRSQADDSSRVSAGKGALDHVGGCCLTIRRALALQIGGEAQIHAPDVVDTDWMKQKSGMGAFCT